MKKFGILHKCSSCDANINVMRYEKLRFLYGGIFTLTTAFQLEKEIVPLLASHKLHLYEVTNIFVFSSCRTSSVRTTRYQNFQHTRKMKLSVFEFKFYFFHFHSLIKGPVSFIQISSNVAVCCSNIN